MIELDDIALKMLLRDPPITRELEEIGKSIGHDIYDSGAAYRTKDNKPRKIHPKSLNAGKGYSHYVQEIEIVTGMDDAMSAVYVLATRHAILQEFGWTPVGGAHVHGRFIMTRALWSHKEDS